MRVHTLASMLLLSACADRIERPIANPGAAPASPAVGVVIQMDGSGSTDPQDLPLTFEWSFVGLPQGSQAALHDPLVANPSFLPDVSGSYVVQLVVSNGVLDSEPVSLTIAVTECGTHAPMVDGLQADPEAPATGQTAWLIATVGDADNVDPCAQGEELSYRWRLAELPAGSVSEISAPAARNPSFTPDVSGSYVVELVVTDSTGLSTTASLTVDVDPCGSNAPEALIAMANPVTTAPAGDVLAPDVAVGANVQLDARASQDPDETLCGLSDPLSYAWSFDRLAPASDATLNAATLDPSFQADRPGTYVVRLTVTDSTGLSDTATLTATADPCVVLALADEFSCSFVRSGTPQGLDQPQGVTVDDVGNIYVVNQGRDNVVRIVPGAISVFAEAGVFDGNWADIVHDPASGSFFVTDTNRDEIIQLSNTGLRSLFSDAGALQEPEGISLFTDCSGTDWLLVASFGNDEVLGFDPTDAPMATPGFTDQMTTNGGNDLATQPRGVAGECLSSSNRIFATRSGGQDGLIRDRADIGGNADDAAVLSTSFALDNPRDVVLTPCPTPKAVVAAAGSGTVTVVDNCGGTPCEVQVIVSGMDDPWGLWFESGSSLLVTDRGSDTLYRITANDPALFDFCDL